MEMQSRVERTLTQLDYVRLRKLSGTGVHAMEDVLDGSEVVESRDIANDVVTMNSQLLLEDGTSAQRYELTLCYPQDAEPASGRVSVLSPVGASLLGAKVGSKVDWKTPGGQSGSAQVISILFQPEAAGDFLR